MEDSTFGFEIDFLPVGDKSDSGDAICMRWGYNLLDKRIRQQTVVLIDGGFVADGEAIVKHIKKWYDSDTIDFMINTHPHRDPWSFHLADCFYPIPALHFAGTFAALPA